MSNTKDVVGPRAISVTLTKDMIKQIGDKLQIRNVDRIPTELVINGLSVGDLVKTMPRGLALPRGVAVVDVIA